MLGSGDCARATEGSDAAETLAEVRAVSGDDVAEEEPDEDAEGELEAAVISGVTSTSTSSGSTPEATNAACIVSREAAP